MQDVTDEDEEQSLWQRFTLRDALPEGPLLSQVLFHLDVCFPVMHVFSNPFVHLSSNTTLAQFQFRTFFLHLVKSLFKVSPYRNGVFLVVEGIFNSLRDVGDLVLNSLILLALV